MKNKFKPKKILGFMGVGVLLLILLVFLPSFFTVVDAGEVGVISTFGKVNDNEMPSGFNFKNPFARVEKMSVQTQEYTMSSAKYEGRMIGDDAIQARAKDGASIWIDITVLFRLSKDKASDVYKEIGINYEEKVIRPAIRSVIRGVAANYTVNEVYSTKRDEVSLKIYEQLEKDLKSRGVKVEDVLLRKINLSETLSKSIEEKLSAQQEAQKFDFILEKEEKEAERKRIEAKGQRDAQKIVSQGLTDEYLYYLYIQNLKDNESTIYVPINPENGLPLFKNVE